jgi:hypothetical protein
MFLKLGKDLLRHVLLTKTREVISQDTQGATQGGLVPLVLIQ